MIKLHAFKMNVVTVEVNPAYSSMVATIKYRKQFGGFNRHQLAAFVIARRALGYGEAPALSCPPGKKEKEKRMWNHSMRYYGYSPVIQTLLHHEPMEWKSGGDDNGGGGVTELLKAPPADTRKGLSHCASASTEAVEPGGITIRRAGRAHSNGHTSQGDGARGYRVNPPSS